MEKSTYFYIGILSLIMIGAGSAGGTGSHDSGFAVFIGEFIGMFFTLYIFAMIISKVKSKFQKTE